MLGELEEQMATILWQVPQQMFAVARTAIYITVKHRDTQIFAKGQWALFVGSQSDHQNKQMGLNLLAIRQQNFEIPIVPLKKPPMLLSKQENTKWRVCIFLFTLWDSKYAVWNDYTISHITSTNVLTFASKSKNGQTWQIQEKKLIFLV